VHWMGWSLMWLWLILRSSSSKCLKYVKKTMIICDLRAKNWTYNLKSVYTILEFGGGLVFYKFIVRKPQHHWQSWGLHRLELYAHCLVSAFLYQIYCNHAKIWSFCKVWEVFILNLIDFIHIPYIQLQADTIGYGTSQIHNICIVLVLPENIIRM
jgi:hypothetical protein